MLLDADRTEIHALLTRIDRAILETLQPDLGDVSLASGLAGVAMYYRALEAAGIPPLHTGFLDRMTDVIYDTVAMTRLPALRLYAGLPGTGLALEHIANAGAGHTEDVSAINDELDDMIVSAMERGGTNGHFDLVSGITGVGVYALARGRAAARKKILGLVLGALDDRATTTSDGICWKTAPAFLGAESLHSAYPDGNFNLGLAHGNPGVIAFLANATLSGDAIPGQTELLRQGCNWLVQQANSDDSECSFSYVAGTRSRSRNAWCYGDAGVALALLRSAKALDSAQLRARAVSVGKRSAMRDVKSAMVFDHGLCHGTAGLALLYLTLYRETGINEFLIASRFWYRELILATREPNLQGLASQRPDGSYALDAGALGGLSGIGLSLIEAVGGGTPGWSRWLLI